MLVNTKENVTPFGFIDSGTRDELTWQERSLPKTKTV